jgi:hypothetical protein
MARMRHEYGLYNVLAIWCGLVTIKFLKMKKNRNTNPFNIDTDLYKSLVFSGPPSYFIITIKSGLKFKYLANSKKDAIDRFIKDQKIKDEQHAAKNNYKVRSLDYKGMILEIEDGSTCG